MNDVVNLQFKHVQNRTSSRSQQAHTTRSCLPRSNVVLGQVQPSAQLSGQGSRRVVG